MMDIHEFEEMAFQSLLADINDQIAALTRQLKVKYVHLLKLKMRVAYLGIEDLAEDTERKTFVELPKEIAAMEQELKRQGQRLAKIKSGE
ncbi:MAG: hypothetical protein JXA21_06655 [Anaerolineae bacterium]|nr:hypothetical protein [Anaerolineae bacterium]